MITDMVRPNIIIISIKTMIGIDLYRINDLIILFMYVNIIS
jgi:hypothetical protein